MDNRVSDTAPVPSRAERFRRSAAIALAQAAATEDPTMKAELIAMAAGWHELAEAVEKTAADLAVAQHPGLGDLAASMA
ncbi:MAG: hypothetical protein JO261_02145 [Alphaproteobacteria bacterium]|nr:hypothetical protein [Alphaproteobacteria bacterium]MBV9692480.1 hypothetical protein [Alphaproteobacteria bacterium]